MKTSILYLYIFFLLFIGCQKKENNSDPPLLNTQWNLVSIQNTKTNAITNYPADVKQVWGYEYISFTKDSITIKGLCNGGGGKYSISTKTDSISFYKSLGMTLALCKYEEWENYLWQNLDSAYFYNINGNNLIIYSKGTYNLNFVTQ
jgi:heat shock protein HslJ